MAWYKSESVKGNRKPLNFLYDIIKVADIGIETIRPILLSIVSYLHNEGIQKIGLLGIGRYDDSTSSSSSSSSSSSLTTLHM